MQFSFFRQSNITEQNYERQMLYRYEYKIETQEEDGVQYLVIQFNKDLKTFKFVEKLKFTRLYIDFCNNVVIDPAPNNVTDLTINKCDLTKLDGIKKMIQLTHLSISDNKLSDIFELRYLINLKELHIDYNQIEDISSLAYLPNLEYLDMCVNLIRDLYPLSKLNLLQNLRALKNQIVNLFPLKFLFGLQFLELSSNKIVHIDSLTKLVGLKRLWISENIILDMSPLNEHPNKHKYNTKTELVPTEMEILYSSKYQSIMETSENLKHMKYLEQSIKESFAELKVKFSQIVAQTTQNQILSTQQIAQLLQNFEIGQTQ
ncbi:leucine-rich_repeat domain-containing protein [Hexamita inflata]|uniref:Leucine-rich repeat domain-containing protein n=1 Tax=Hexamita inflata TaxID=28002 RepID=A0AA86Q499_9EUKA|nr:leucine-rich repeat domain-containing protein [Hexamita inflata]